MTISPLAPKSFPELAPIKGVRLGAVEAGIKNKNRKDVMLMHFAPGSVMAGVFTTSATRSAPVLHSQEIIGREGDDGIAVLANSGNSNAFTGRTGAQACERCLSGVASAIGLDTQSVHMASTGVIGVPLDEKPILAQIDSLIANLNADAWQDTARAIMTTDTFPKGASVKVKLGDALVTINGIAKGSGMIAPNMATMLGFLATDANISQEMLQMALMVTTQLSFNAITVDSDTSTSDSVYFGATRQADMEEIKSVDDPRFETFQDALQGVMLELAHLIVKDGEGATKFVEVKLTGAVSEASAKVVAMAIANSPLVKTAIAGEDPNWGRIVMAVGKAGEPADRDKITIHFGNHLVAKNGMVAPEYEENIGATYMKGENLVIAVDLGLGQGAFTAWTCDFTKRYIEINADYRS